jgi:anion-transporting  ArsA/GET3 family ATPase
MAMEKLGQLHRDAMKTGAYDLIVVDTPPSRSALDFLDAPNRLGRFLDGRMVRLLTAPAKAGGKAYMKVVTVSVGMVARVFTKVIGGDLLNDLSTFVTALESMFGGFRERAQHTYELLKNPGTAFVVVAAPEPDALREASYFVERLSAEHMPLAGVIVNRTRQAEPVAGAAPLTAARAELAADGLDEKLASAKTAATKTVPTKSAVEAAALATAALRVHAEIAAAAEHDARMTKRFSSAHPQVPLVPLLALPADVHDLDGLRTIGKLLGA